MKTIPDKDASPIALLPYGTKVTVDTSYNPLKIFSYPVHHVTIKILFKTIFQSCNP